jgi:hypothetical protein
MIQENLNHAGVLGQKRDDIVRGGVVLPGFRDQLRGISKKEKFRGRVYECFR